MNKLAAFILLLLFDFIIDKGQLYYAEFGLEEHHMQTLCQMIQSTAAYYFIFWLIEYKHLILKTIAFQFLLTEIWDVLQYLYVDDGFTYLAAAANALVFIPWLIYAVYRSYNAGSVETKQDTIYLISKKPDNFWTFFPSLFTGTSGYSILCNGIRYGYKHGAFEIMDFSSQDNDYNFVTETSIKYAPELINYLKSKQGENWHLWDNCITVHFKLKWMDWHV